MYPNLPIRLDKDGDLPVTLYVSRTRQIFLGLNNALLGVGSARYFEKCIWINRQCVVAQGDMNLDLGASPYEEKAIATFVNLEGIVPTYSVEKYEMLHMPKMTVIQPIMKYTLGSWLKEKNPLSAEDKRSITLQLLKGLRAIAKEGIHRDIYEHNILMDRGDDGQIIACFTDFGCFSFYNGYWHHPIIPEYAPPEYHINSTLTNRLDVWMLGLNLYMLYTGQEPYWFQWNNPKDRYKIGATVPRLKEDWLKLPLDLPEPVCKLLRSMLHPDWQKRCSAEEALLMFMLQDTLALGVGDQDGAGGIAKDVDCGAAHVQNPVDGKDKG